MANSKQQFAEALRSHFGDRLISVNLDFGEINAVVSTDNYIEVATELRDIAEFGFQQLVDLSGVDYSQFGQAEWQTKDASRSGFSRGVGAAGTTGRLQFGDELEPVNEQGYRFAVSCHLLSYSNNRRLRLKVYAPDDSFPVVPSVTVVWNAANWYEREAFDLFGILFSDHPDLRRIMTDYGFVGHPFRKDFPLVGHVEMRYDPEKGRVVYEPVTIETRVLVPRVIREDNRYLPSEQSDEEEAQNDA